MTQHQGASLLSRVVLDRAGNLTADTAQAVRSPGSATLHQLDGAVLEARTFRHYHDAEVTAGRFPTANFAADLFHVERNLRNENDVGAAGKSAIQRNPSRVAAHQLDHHH